MSVRSLALGSLVGGLTYAQTDHHRVLKAILAGLSSAAFAALSQILSRSVIGLKRELYPIEEWVGQYEEDAVEPDIAVFDPHHHLWDPRIHDNGWALPAWVLKMLYMMKPKIADNLFLSDPKNGPLRNTFGLTRCPFLCPYMGAELAKDICGNGRGHKVVGTVYVEFCWKTPGVEKCMEPVREADMVEEEHRRFPHFFQGIVAHADLRLGSAVEPALKYYAEKSLVKGIRHSLFCTPDPTIIKAAHVIEAHDMDTAYDATFREGFALLKKYGFSFDCWLCHENIAALTDLSKAFPDTTIIANHMCQPLGIGCYSRQETLPKWKELLKGLALQNNVYMKIGGFGMRVPGFGFDERATPPSSDELVEAWGPYITFCIETFGVDRCLMESNFPVDKISCSYTVLINALKKSVKSYSKEDKRKLFELNAKRVYRIS